MKISPAVVTWRPRRRCHQRLLAAEINNDFGTINNDGTITGYPCDSCT